MATRPLKKDPPPPPLITQNSTTKWPGSLNRIESREVPVWISKRKAVGLHSTTAKRLEKSNRNGRRALSGVSLRYGKKYLRGTEKTFLFLRQLGEDSNPKKDAGETVWGYFLQQEADQKDIEQVEGLLCCHLGKENTTPQKKRRTLAVVYSDLRSCVKMYSHLPLSEQRTGAPNDCFL